MAFDPNAFLAATAPPASSSSPAAFDPKAFLTATAKPEVGTGEAVLRGLAQGASLGFADELTGAAESLVTDKTYQQARDESRAAYRAAQEEHPYAYGGAELAGGIASSFVPGMGAAKAGATIGRAALKYGAQGALAGLGSSEADLTKGDVAGAAKDAATGAATGAVVGGALHGIGKKLGGAEDRFVSDVASDTGQRARPKDQLQLRRMLEADQGSASLSSKDVLFEKEQKGIVNDIRAGKIPEAREKIGDRVRDLMGPENSAYNHDYKVVDQHTRGVHLGDVTGAIDERIANLSNETGTQAQRKVLEAVKKDLTDVFAKESGDPLAGIKAAAKWDPRAALTLKAIKSGGVTEEAYQSALQNYPRIQASQLRKAVTKAQDSAIEALGSIAETEHAKLRAEGKQVLEGVLRSHLDEAATKSEAAAKAVQSIRDRDKRLSTLLTIDKSLEQRQGKELLQKKSLGQTIGHQTTGLAHLGAAAMFSSHPGGALALAAAPHVLAGASKLGRVSNDALARLIYQATHGNANAQRMLASLQRTPAVAARLAALRATGPAAPATDINDLVENATGDVAADLQQPE